MNGEIRLCGDLKVTLNNNVSVDQYPLQKTEDLFQKFHKSNYKIFNHEHYLWLYVYNRICFGSSSASAIFQSIIDRILEGIKCCGAYQDYILIGGKDYNSCKSVLYSVLNGLNNYDVKVNCQKSEYFVESLQMLGYVLSADIEKLINTKSLQNVTQLGSYLGLFNYCHKIIKMAPDVMEPLHNLLRHSVSWEWIDECEVLLILKFFLA
ncbi:hypothetical protein PR048_001927 [Dryococelus australis]|uniref:Reverse transcriptase domain-containing protein n=1 Tax=Dryococelus australis TaxID=614101 RepID=A0ABQ9IIR2_9NEOP|nr:hypothetical protein PR048_001927 [Dryococelus australis]